MRSYCLKNTLVLEPRAATAAKSLTNNQGMIWLDIAITKELEDEGIAKDIIRLVQQAHKSAGFDVLNRIKLELKSNFDLTMVLAAHGKFISEQTLSEFATDFDADYKTQASLLDRMFEIAVKR